MGLDLTGTLSALQGLIIQDSRFVAANISDTLSSEATQAGPIPGVPEAQQDTDLVLEAVGSQSAAQALRIQALRSGHPGTDEASCVWRYEGDSLYRGWDPPVSISDFEYIDFTTDSTAWTYPHAVALPDGTIVCVARYDRQIVTCWVRDPATGTWSDSQVYDAGAVRSLYPCLVRLPSGRLVCFFWHHVGAQATVRMHYSDDGGASWTLGQKETLPTPINTSSFTVGRLRAAYLNGNIVLIMELEGSAAPYHRLYQYASIDLGCTFAFISETSTGNSRHKPDVITYAGKLFVAYISYDSTPQVIPYVRVLGAADEPLTSADPIAALLGTAEWGQQTSDAFTAAELAIMADEDGSLYLIGVDYNASGGADREMIALRSTDQGETWEAVSGSSAPASGAALWHGRDAAFWLDDLCAVAWRGCGVVIHGAQTGEEAVADLSQSLMATFFGGHTTVCMPEYSTLGAHQLVNRASWEHTWLPFCSPEDLPAYTLTLSAPPPTIASTALGRGVLHTNAAHFAAWAATLATGLDEGGIYLVEIDHDANTSLTSEVDVMVTNGSTISHGLGIRVTGTQISARNAPAGTATGAALATVTTAAAMDGIQLLVAVGNGIGSAWWRPRGPTDRAWSPILTNQVLSAGSATVGLIRFRTLPGVTSGTVWFKLACFCEGAFTGQQLAGGQINPSDLLGRTLMPTPVYVDDGLSIYASDGPTKRPDTWNVNTRYVYGYRNTDPRHAPSPARQWRTLTDDSDADAAWVLGASTSDEHGLLGSMLALYLGNINWRTGELWARSGGVWSKIADIDAAAGMTGLAYTRRGQTIHPNLAAGSSANRYMPEHIHAGSTWDFGTGTPKIRTNAEGAWTLGSVGTTLPPRLLLEDYETGDSASGTAGAIWSKDVLVLVPLAANVDYDALYLRVKAQTTADGDLRTGVAMLGRFLPFGAPYSAGRAIGVEPLYDLSEGRNGARRVRARSQSVRRSVEFDWTDGVWSGGLWDAAPHPDYLRAYTGAGGLVATPAALPWAVQGAYERARGAVDPVVYVARAPIGSTSAVITITDRARMLYGRIVSEAARLDVAEGDEFSIARPEYVRVNTMRVEEEL